MPQALIAATLAYVFTGVSFAVGAGSLAAAIQFVAIVGASMAASKLLAPKMPSFSDSSLSDRSQMVRSPISARTIVYGKTRVSGTVVYLSTTGATNEYLHIIVTLAGHEIEAIDEIYFNDELVELDPVNTNVPTGFYNGVARVNKKLGVPGDTADADLIADTVNLTDGKWTADHKLSGIAYLYVRLTWDAEKFPSGIPNISAVIRGKKVEDPRTQPPTVAYSANAALCLRDYLLDASLGMGMTSAEVDDTAFGVAATICEEQVQIKPVSPVVNENRYEANGVIVTSASPDENIGKLLSAMGGLIAYTGGRIVPYASAFRIPTVTLSEKHFVGPINVQTKTSARDRVNSVKGVYVSETNAWQVTDFPTISSTTFVNQDGGNVFFRDVVLPFTTSPSCAQRLAVLELRRARTEITMSARFRLEAMQLRAGDTVMITNEQLGFVSKVFEVMEWNFASDGTPPQIFIDMTLRETASTVYSYTVNDEVFVEDAPKTTLPDPFTLAAPTNLTLTADGTTQFIQADGAVVPRIKVNWTAPSVAMIQSGGKVVVEYKPSASTTYLTWANIGGADTETFISSDVRIGTNYNVRIYGESIFKVSTTYLNGSITVAPDTTPPGVPQNLTAIAGTGQIISLDWDDVTDSDLGEYGVYRNTSNNPGAAAEIAQTRASRFVDVSLTLNQQYFYWVTAYDRIENQSAKSATASATAVAVVAGQTDPTPPVDPAAPTIISTSSYPSSDGTTFATIVVGVPAFTTRTVVLNVLYKKVGQDGFIVADQRSVGGGSSAIDDLTPGVNYLVAVQAFSAFGIASSIISGPTQVAASKTTAPNAPTNLSAVAGSGQIISLDWDDSAAADLGEYGVYRNTSNNPGAAAEIAQTRASRFVDVGLTVGVTAGIEYFYWVTAYDRTENQSAKSATASATAQRVVAGQTDANPPVDPDAPTVISTSSYQSSDGTTFAQIVVGVPAFTTRTVVLNVLYRKVGQTGFIVADQRSVGGGTSAIDDLTPGTNYEIAVQAFSAFGIASSIVAGPTQVAASKTTAPNAPTGLTAIAGSGQIISLDWDDSVAVDFGEYGIYRNTINNPGTAAEIAQTRASRFVDVALTVGVTAGIEYFYYVTAYDRSENQSAKSVVASATAQRVVAGQTDANPPVDPAAPSVASTTTYLSSDGTVFAQIVVSVPAFTARTAVMNVLYRKSGQAGFIVADQRSTGGGTSSIDDLTPAVSYEIAVQAFSAFGIGSAVVTGPTQLAPSKTTANPPTNVTYVAGNDAEYGGEPVYYQGLLAFCTRINWLPPADKDVVGFEAAFTAEDTDVAADNAAAYTFVTTFEFIASSMVTNPRFFRLRSVNASGVRSSWAGGGQSLAQVQGIPAGTMSNQDANAVAISGGTVSGITDIAIADGGTGASTASAARANLGINRFSHVQNLTGGSPTETFTFTHSLGVTQDFVLAACVDPANDLLIAHDYAAAGNTSNDTIFEVATADGSNISAGNRRFTIHFVQ